MARPLRISAATADALLKRTKRSKGRPKREDRRALHFQMLREQLEVAEGEEPDAEGKTRDPVKRFTHHYLAEPIRCGHSGCNAMVNDLYQVWGRLGPVSVSDRMCIDCAKTFEKTGK